MVEMRDVSARSERETASSLLNMKIGIKRLGKSVQISLQCDADYQAMELYDRLVDAAQRGEVTIDLKAW